jgi:hypothetical protein
MTIEDCWDEISAANCVYGRHAFDGKELQVFVERGLDTWSERLQNNVQADGARGVGRCVLIFRDVTQYCWRETPFTKSIDGSVAWGEAVNERYGEDEIGDGAQYFLDGTVLDGSRVVWAEVRARSFALEIK